MFFVFGHVLFCPRFHVLCLCSTSHVLHMFCVCSFLFLFMSTCFLILQSVSSFCAFGYVLCFLSYFSKTNKLCFPSASLQNLPNVIILWVAIATLHKHLANFLLKDESPIIVYSH